MRMYNSRLGRFLSVDPLTRKYPELTPYQYASNRPIASVDIDGLEGTPLPSVAANVSFNIYDFKASFRFGVGIQFNNVGGQSAAINISNDNKVRLLAVNAYVNINSVNGVPGPFPTGGLSFPINHTNTVKLFGTLANQNFDPTVYNLALFPLNPSSTPTPNANPNSISSIMTQLGYLQDAALAGKGKTPPANAPPMDVTTQQQGASNSNNSTGASQTSPYNDMTVKTPPIQLPSVPQPPVKDDCVTPEVTPP